MTEPDPYAMMASLIFRNEGETWEKVTTQAEAEKAVALIFEKKKTAAPLRPEEGAWNVMVSGSDLTTYGWRDRERGIVGFGDDDTPYMMVVYV